MTYEYRCFPELVHTPYTRPYIAYGILATWTDPRGRRRFFLVHDVLLSGKEAKKLADRFTQHNLSAIHLKEAIEDALSGQEIGSGIGGDV